MYTQSRFRVSRPRLRSVFLRFSAAGRSADRFGSSAFFSLRSRSPHSVAELMLVTRSSCSRASSWRVTSCVLACVRRLCRRRSRPQDAESDCIWQTMEYRQRRSPISRRRFVLYPSVRVSDFFFFFAGKKYGINILRLDNSFESSVKKTRSKISRAKRRNGKLE